MINRQMFNKQKENKYMKKMKKAVNAAFSIFLLTVLTCVPVFAAGGEPGGPEIITNGFTTIYNIIAAIVSSVGTMLLLWGVFEWAQALNTQDGGAQSMAFKRIASGLVACLAPQLIPLITSSF